VAKIAGPARLIRKLPLIIKERNRKELSYEANMRPK
jgi:hypothetical protein